MTQASDMHGETLRRAFGALQAGRPGEAERLAGEVLASRPDRTEALHLCGLARLAQGRASEALDLLRRAAAVTADAVIETHLAIALRQSGNAAAAVEVLERAVGRQPPFVLAFHELAVVLFAQRRLDEAQAVLARGLAVAPGMPELCVLLGGIHLDRLQRDAARAAFARALASAPGHPGALFGMGSVLSDTGDFAAAVERFRQALAHDPGYVQARLALGNCLLELDRLDEALEQLRAAVRAAPHVYGKALRTLVAAGRGRFWLRPSAAAALLAPTRP